MYNINYCASPAPEVMKTLNAGLSEHAMQVLGATSLESFGFTAHNDAGEIIGGCTGFLMFGLLGVIPVTKTSVNPARSTVLL